MAGGRAQGRSGGERAGSLNFNGLETRDAEGAKAFYGAVFGWTTLALPGGAEMWTLPGYGDHLESLQPGLRDQIAAVGGPPGFEDVVASLNPIADDQPTCPRTGASRSRSTTPARSPSAPASWAERCWCEPMDAPWSRITVIKDPQGATFIASQFVVENQVR